MWNIGEDDFLQLPSDSSCTSQRYGFTLDLPNSWQNYYYTEETLQGEDFFY